MTIKQPILLFLLTAFTLCANAKDSVGDIGSVTIDGTLIPELQYQAYVDRNIWQDELICPPLSDAFIRDQVIGVWLRHLEAQATGMLTDQIKSAQEELAAERASNTGLDELGKASYDLQEKNILSYALKRANQVETTPSRLVDHYQYLIKTGNTGLVNVPLIRRRELSLWSPDQVETAKQMLAEGSTIQLIADKLDRSSDNLYQADDWFALDSLDYSLGDSSSIEPGKIYGPLEGGYDPVLVFVEELKVVSRIRPGSSINMDWKYAISYAEKNLRFAEQYGLSDAKLDELWAKYPVMLDGKPLAKAAAYATCPK